MKKLFLSFALLTLSVGLWAENPPMPPAGEITFEGLSFRALDNEHVEVVCKIGDKPEPYSGNIVVPEWFNFTDTKENQYILTVTKIGANAFNTCPELTSVALPASIKFIGDNAFANCEKLTSITCLGTTPATLGEDVFADHNDALTIYVPIWTKDAYKEKWSEYEGFISLTELDQKKEDVLYQIQTARQGIQNTEINMMINDAVNRISSATTKEVTKGDKSVTLINPEKVNFIKVSTGK